MCQTQLANTGCLQFYKWDDPHKTATPNQYSSWDSSIIDLMRRMPSVKFDSGVTFDYDRNSNTCYPKKDKTAENLGKYSTLSECKSANPGARDPPYNSSGEKTGGGGGSGGGGSGGGSKMWLVILLIAVIIAASALAIYFFVLKKPSVKSSRKSVMGKRSSFSMRKRY